MLAKREYILVSLILVIGVVMVINTSYSFVNKSFTTENAYSFSVGNLDISFTEQNNIVLENSKPITDEKGLEQEKEFIFTVTNNGKYTVNYTLKVEETSKENIGEVIKYTYNYNDNGYNYYNILSENNVIGENIVIPSNTSYTYKMKFWISDKADSSYMGKTFSAKISLEATQNDYKYASDIISKLNNKDEVLSINNEGNFGEKDIREYRYTDNTQNNYVYFNCDDGYTKGKTCELYRIIGVFDKDLLGNSGIYKMLKITRDEPVVIEDKIEIIDEEEVVTKTDPLEYLNNEFYNTLKDNTKDYIMETSFNNGDVTLDLNNHYTYLRERDNYTYLNIGLVNISDFTYASKQEYSISSIESNNYLSSEGSYHTMNNYCINNKVTECNTNNYKIALYLRPDISIIGGFGTKDNPYQLSIKYKMNYGLSYKIEKD